MCVCVNVCIYINLYFVHLLQILRSDLLMDVGNSLNPAIDIGQVEGAFTQGLGLFTMEECVVLKDGRLFTNGPGNYKIPSCSDIPIELNVSLMDHTPNPRAIFSSKVTTMTC